MTDFETAARKAAEEILDMHSDFSMCPELLQGAIDESAGFITKHFAEIAEVQGKLVELAAITKNYFGCDDLYRIDGNPESRGKIRLTRDDYKAALFAKLTDPQVAALIERMRG